MQVSVISVSLYQISMKLENDYLLAGGRRAFQAPFHDVSEVFYGIDIR